MPIFTLKSTDSISELVIHYVTGILVGVAMAGKTIPYSNIGAMFGVDVRAGDGQRQILSRLLGVVGSREHQIGHPVITAVVVFKENEYQSELVGTGFDALMKELRIRHDPDPIVNHAVELKRCYDFWKPQGQLQ